LQQRTSIEKVASNGQKKQAEQVNKGRVWKEGENIPKDTVCTLYLGQDHNKVGIKKFTSACLEAGALPEIRKC